MEIVLTNQIIFPFLILIFLITILGYGNFLNYFLRLDNFLLNLKNFLFIQGLILISFFTLLINIFTPLNNYVTFIIIFIGIILYLVFNIKNNLNKNEIIFICFVTFLSFVYSFYSGVNDDYHYHFETIKNFKNHNLFEIIHNNRISYNSHWLFLNSVFTINGLYASTFVISALLYSITIFDCFFLFKKTFSEKFYYTCILSFSILIFFLGVINNYKEIGTDIPGVIISLYILVILTYYNFDKKVMININLFIFMIILANFAFVIKITNTLIYFYLLSFLLAVNFNSLKLNFLILLFPIPLLWFFQNINISGCLIWPIEITCIENKTTAEKEINIIKTFAKGDQFLSNSTLGYFEWIGLWFKNHFTKLLETYLIFFIVLISPIFYLYLNNKKNQIIQKNIIYKVLGNKNYIFFLSIIVISNLIWFLYMPAYRFGILYNFSLIVYFIIPLWLNYIDKNREFFQKFCFIVICLIVIYFIFENTLKINWYFERYNTWPPFTNQNLILRN